VVDSTPSFLNRWIIPTLLLAVCARIPFLWLGYGEDPDAWLVAHAAKNLWDTGTYNPSRLPGYLIYEIVSAPLVALGGAALSNAATLVASIALLFPWWSIARRWTRYPFLTFLPLAFAPIVWTTSTVTMDYIWSLLFIVLGLKAALESRPVVAGLAVGIACGFRPSNFVLMFPLAVLLRYVGSGRHNVFRFLMATLATCIICFIPLLLKYGPVDWVRSTIVEMSDVLPPLPERLAGFSYRTVYFLGPMASLTVLIVLINRFKDLRQALRDHDPIITSAVVAIAACLLLFIGLPLERAYLLPMLPFLCLMVARLASRLWQIVFVAAIVSLSLFNPDVISHTIGPRSYRFTIREGRIAEAWQLRKATLRMRERIPGLRFERETFLMVGDVIPLAFENALLETDSTTDYTRFSQPVLRSRLRPELHFVNYLTPTQVAWERSKGLDIYCLQAAQRHVETVTNCSLAKIGVHVLSPPSE